MPCYRACTQVGPLYDALRDAGLAALSANPSKVQAGRDWGEDVGNEVVSLRANDGSSPGETQPGGNGPGEFRADFTSAQYRNMDPFAIASAAPYLSAGPPALDQSRLRGCVQ